MDYHEQTKHHYHRFARSIDEFDWDNQPKPFRRCDGAPFHRLPLLPLEDLPAYENLFKKGSIASEPVSEKSLSGLFRHSLAISAWKSYEGSRWALRVNPSSGNLHPTEGYAILNSPDSGITAGVYHYLPEEHGLERRATLPPILFQQLMQGFPAGAFLVGFTSIHWREAWKYGERPSSPAQTVPGDGMTVAAFPPAQNMIAEKPFPCTNDSKPNCNRHD